MHPLTLALIGLPLYAGVLARFAFAKEKFFLLSLVLSSQLFLVVGIGYVFANYEKPRAFILDHKVATLTTGLLVGPFVLILIADFITRWRRIKVASEDVDFVGSAFFVAYIGMWIFCESRNSEQPIGAFATVMFFLILGAVNSVLGPIASGFSFSAAVHSYFATGSLDYIPIWKTVFEMLDIETAPLKLTVLVLSIAVSAVEPVASAVSKITATQTSR